MGKENRLFIVFIIIIICSLVGTLFYVDARAKNITPATSTLTQEDRNKLITKLVEVPVLSDNKEVFSDPLKKLTMDIHFPKVTLAQHPELAKDANTVILAFIHDNEESFKKDVEDLYSPNIPKSFSSDLTVRWSPLLVSPTIISVRFDISEYVAGSAHPNSRTRIFNYDLERHLLLQTPDLFASSTRALPYLSEYSRKELRTILADESKDMFTSQAVPGTEATNENFQEVGITKTGLLIVFAPYQVAPYARGTIQLPISFATITEEISPRIKDAVIMAEANIIEATPEEQNTPTSTKMEQ